MRVDLLDDTLGTLLDAMPNGVLVVETDGRIVRANREAERLFGYGRGELVGQPVEALLPEGHRENRAGRVLEPGSELTARHRDGREIAVEIGINALETDAGPMVLAAIVDITARKERERDLRRANQGLVHFTSAASHDLRAPLRGISDLVAWISEDLGPSPPETIKRNLDRVVTRVERMKRLIDDWLAYARAGHTAADLTDIDVAAMVDGILELLPRPPGFEIEIDIDADAARLRATRVPLETALRNLIDNAIKHHDRPRGRIRISVREEDAHCVFAVSDDGPGIPFSAAEQVLAPFAMLTDSDGPGVGIGLALTKQLLDLHGGRIEIRSNDAARGTTSRFWWPRLDGMVCDGSGK